MGKGRTGGKRNRGRRAIEALDGRAPQTVLHVRLHLNNDKTEFLWSLGREEIGREISPPRSFLKGGAYGGYASNRSTLIYSEYIRLH